MFKVKHDTKQLFLSGQEGYELVKELEQIFILADSESPMGMYSSINIQKDYPVLSELFNVLHR